MSTIVTEDMIYLAALSRLKGIGARSIIRIIEVLPTQQALRQVSLKETEEKLGRALARAVNQGLEQWPSIWNDVQEKLERYASKHVVPIPLMSDAYPPLLRTIPDPPVMLYAKGNLALLQLPCAVAIVGTRQPTRQGTRVARYLAQQWVRHNYVVISGLAKGIDTAAHEGALDAQGKTIAVLGTSLDKIYPAENKGLAERIVSEGGLLLSEMLLGQPGFKMAFVQRDRIQSGLSLGVFPVQTRRGGGTMHTVNFAKEHQRYIICPRPVAAEEGAAQYEGIWFLIQEKKIPSFSIDQERAYEMIQDRFQALLPRLLEIRKPVEGNKEQFQAPDPWIKNGPLSLWDIEDQEVKTD